jgi:exodeoxyribonuclease-5
MELSGEQQEIFDVITSNLYGVQTLGGYAGTGKTTLVCALAAHLPNYAVCAYTGKAAHVLRQKGCKATTIHQLVYIPVDNSFAQEMLQRQLAEVRQMGSVAAVDSLLLDMKEAQKPRYALREELSNRQGEPIDGIIVDEASMVSERVHNDLLSFGLPLIFVGDHGQLPPVSDDRAFNLMAEPMYRLEKIHRNAGPIAHFAQHLRRGGAPRAFAGGGDAVQVLPRRAVTTDLLTSASQVICRSNAQRVDINCKIHMGLWGTDEILIPGERIICLRNDHGAGLYNGQQGTVVCKDESRMVMDFEDDSGAMHVDVEFDPEQFGEEYYHYQRGGPHPFDLGYCVTCHKAQGSEWPHVLVHDPRGGDDYHRWTYTAASRARERLTWIC